ncbi:MAG TPA: OmpA family protein [Tepidisphaeraceae bacterium]|nr:OmpA family protein [Tepidisphaeraceae bacterium]
MRSIFRGIVAAGLLAGAGFGCQSSMYSENKDLRNQNLELQQQLDDAHRQQAVAAAQPAPQPIQAAAVTPKPVEIAPPPAPAPVAVEPAPAPAPVAVKPDFGGLEVTHNAAAGTTTVNLPSDIFFSSGQAMLLPDAKKSLAKVASVLKKEYGSKQIKIEGYTDSDPIKKSHWKSNEELSQKRAEAVRDFLVSKGVSAKLVSTEGLGPKNPKSKTDKAKNRRVELVVLTR